MGNMTVVVVRNDNESDIRNNSEEFVQALCAKLRSGDNGPICGDAAFVHGSEGADSVQLIAAGGSYTTKVFSHYAPRLRHSQRDDQVELLLAWADSLGFDITPKAPTSCKKR